VFTQRVRSKVLRPYAIAPQAAIVEAGHQCELCAGAHWQDAHHIQQLR
jgi:hypothetical protein